jgi:protein SCO1/2
MAEKLKKPSRRALLPVLVFVAGLFALGVAVLSVLSGHEPAGAAIGGPFRLTAQDGRSVTEADFAGRPVLVFFGYTHCPDVCPTTMFEISEIFRALGPDAKISALFVTVDTERDTPQALKDYLSSFDPRITGLSGDRAAIDAAIKSYRVYARKVPSAKGDDYTMDHTAIVYLLDKSGRFVAPFNIARPPDAAAQELAKYL